MAINKDGIEFIHDPKSKYWKINHNTKARYCQGTNVQFIPRKENSRLICTNFNFSCIGGLCGFCPDFESSEDHFSQIVQPDKFNQTKSKKKRKKK